MFSIDFLKRDDDKLLIKFDYPDNGKENHDKFCRALENLSNPEVFLVSIMMAMEAQIREDSDEFLSDLLQSMLSPNDFMSDNMPLIKPSEVLSGPGRV